MEQAAIEVQDGGVGVSAETCERLSCDSSVVVMRHGSDGSVLDVGRKTRSIPPAIRRALQARDARCQFPGCAARRYDAHHLVHWAHGGSTGVENLTLLCRRHHRLVHEGGIGVRRGTDGRVTFHLANGGCIEPAPAPPVWSQGAGLLRRLGATTASPATTRSRPTVTPGALGVQIDAHSAPCWDGTPFSLALVIDIAGPQTAGGQHAHTCSLRARLSRTLWTLSDLAVVLDVSIREQRGVGGTQRTDVVAEAAIIARPAARTHAPPPARRPTRPACRPSHAAAQRPRRHLAIGRGGVEHRHLIERRRKAQRRAFREEDHVVLMPIGIRDERAERIQPAQAARVFIGEPPGVPQQHRRPGPRIRRIVVHRGETRHHDTAAHADAIESLAFEKTV